MALEIGGRETPAIFAAPPLPRTCTIFSTIWNLLSSPLPVPWACAFHVHRCSWTPNMYNWTTFRSYKSYFSRILEIRFHAYMKTSDPYSSPSYVHAQDLAQSCSWSPHPSMHNDPVWTSRPVRNIAINSIRKILILFFFSDCNWFTLCRFFINENACVLERRQNLHHDCVLTKLDENMCCLIHIKSTMKHVGISEIHYMNIFLELDHSSASNIWTFWELFGVFFALISHNF